MDEEPLEIKRGKWKSSTHEVLTRKSYINGELSLAVIDYQRLTINNAALRYSFFSLC
jgi:hypothetical protein